MVELPALAADDAATRTTPRPVAVAARRRGRQAAARILVVEDEPTVSQLVADVLGEDGHQVEAVLDSQEGLSRALRQSYDLIVCDLRMPRLDGRAFYEALLRADSPARHRILFITGDTLGPRTAEFLEKNGLPFLGKPFLVEELKAVVYGLLEGSPAPHPERAPRTLGAGREAAPPNSTGPVTPSRARRETTRKK